MPLRRGSRFGSVWRRAGDLAPDSHWSLSGVVLAASAGICSGMVTMGDGQTPGWTSPVLRHVGGLSEPASSVVNLNPLSSGVASSTLAVNGVSSVTPRSGGVATGYVIVGARSTVTPLSSGVSSGLQTIKATTSLAPRGNGVSSSTGAAGAWAMTVALGSGAASGRALTVTQGAMTPLGSGVGTGRALMAATISPVSSAVASALATVNATGAVTPASAGAASGLLTMGDGAPEPGWTSFVGRWFGGLSNASGPLTPLGSGVATGTVTFATPLLLNPVGAGIASAIVASKATTALIPRSAGQATGLVMVGSGSPEPGWTSVFGRHFGGLSLGTGVLTPLGSGASTGLVLVKGSVKLDPQGVGVAASGAVTVGAGVTEPAFRSWFGRYLGGFGQTVLPSSPALSSGVSSGMAHFTMQVRVEGYSTDIATGMVQMFTTPPITPQGVGIASARVTVTGVGAVTPRGSGISSGFASFAVPIYMDPVSAGASTGMVSVQNGGSSPVLGAGAASGMVNFGPLNLQPKGHGASSGLVDMRAGTVLISARSNGAASSIATFADIALMTPRSFGLTTGYAQPSTAVLGFFNPLGSGVAHGRVIFQGYAVDPVNGGVRVTLISETDDWQLREATDEFNLQPVTGFELVKVR